MKKLVWLVSAAMTAIFGSAQAAVDTTGSYEISVASGSGSSSTLQNGGAVSFALSSDLGNGVTVSTSAGITLDSNDTATDAVAVSGLSVLSIATGGATIKIGGDVDLAGDGVGEVGGATGDAVDEGGYGAGSLGTGTTDEDGWGFHVTAPLGTATFAASYIMDSASPKASYSASNNSDTASGVEITVPMGDLAVKAGFANDNGNSETSSAGEVHYTMGSNTFKVGYVTVDATTDSSGTFANWSGSLGSASVTVGYQSISKSTNKSQRTEARVSQSIGAGASVFLDIQNYSGYVTGTAGTNVALGTSFSF